jgi:SAM-dependent methyltransferase
MRDYNPDIYNKNCPICDNATSIWGCVDFNKSCEELNGTYLDYCGVPIYYLKCQHCNHIFSTDFDDWDFEDFKENIYNDDYIVVDPEYDGTRSKRDAEMFLKMINYNKNIDILDYGSGNGFFEKELTTQGYNIHSYDPLWENIDLSDKKFDIITAFEVLEHSNKPLDTLNELCNFLKPNGKILITTLVNDILQGKRDPTYWYLAPRNGHVSMFSNKSLEILFSKKGFSVKHLAWNTHLIE